MDVIFEGENNTVNEYWKHIWVIKRMYHILWICVCYCYRSILSIRLVLCDRYNIKCYQNMKLYCRVRLTEINVHSKCHSTSNSNPFFMFYIRTKDNTHTTKNQGFIDFKKKKLKKWWYLDNINDKLGGFYLFRLLDDNSFSLVTSPLVTFTFNIWVFSSRLLYFVRLSQQSNK